MSDRATPNLPGRDFEVTAAFYGKLGFEVGYKSPEWMVLERGGLTLEFFPHPGLNPAQSWFSCCLRLDDLDGFYATCLEAGLAEAHQGMPRLHPPRIEAGGLRIGYLVDLDGSAIRLIQN
jgi:catechol 2,3-dioxygenase-like lactoylglutathione lyase family enzyme